MWANFKSTFGKSMKSVNVTNRVLQERLRDKSEYEAKHDIRPLTTKEIELILGEQDNKNDKFDHTFLLRSLRPAKGRSQLMKF